MCNLDGRLFRACLAVQNIGGAAAPLQGSVVSTTPEWAAADARATAVASPRAIANRMPSCAAAVGSGPGPEPLGAPVVGSKLVRVVGVRLPNQPGLRSPLERTESRLLLPTVPSGQPARWKEFLRRVATHDQH